MYEGIEHNFFSDINAYERTAQSDSLYEKKHTHEETEIIMITKGSVEITFHDASYTLFPKTIIIINKNISYSIKKTPDESDFFLIMYPKKVNTYPDVNVKVPYLITKEDDKSYNEISGIIEDIRKHLEESEYSQSYLKGDAYHLIGFIKRHSLIEPAPNNKNEKLLNIIRYIDANYSENITLTNLSRLFYITPAYLCRMFKQGTDYSVTSYINYLRIKKAKILLSETDKSVMEILNTVGFTSQSYFNKTFKTATGMTPGEYRKYTEKKES